MHVHGLLLRHVSMSGPLQAAAVFPLWSMAAFALRMFLESMATQATRLCPDGAALYEACAAHPGQAFDSGGHGDAVERRASQLGACPLAAAPQPHTRSATQSLGDCNRGFLAHTARLGARADLTPRASQIRNNAAFDARKQTAVQKSNIDGI